MNDFGLSLYKILKECVAASIYIGYMSGSTSFIRSWWEVSELWELRELEELWELTSWSGVFLLLLLRSSGNCPSR